MNLITRQNFSHKGILAPNTFIGGAASTVPNIASLATKLAISSSRITNFSIVGSDIQCHITGTYDVPTNAFTGFGITPYITYYRDVDSLVRVVNQNSFGTNFQLLNIVMTGATVLFDFQAFYKTGEKIYNFPNLTDINGSDNLRECPNSELIYIPICTKIGASHSVNNGNFTGIKTGTIIYAHPSMATINGGGVEADLAAATAAGNTVRYVANFTAPNPVTTLSAGTIYNTAIQLTFTPPSSTNAIDYYELYKDGVYLKRVISGEYITGLTESTAYNFTIYARDIYYNLSAVSNVLTISTTNRVAVDTDAIAYITASSNTTYQDIIDDMFASLKTASLYTKLQAFYPFLGTTSAQHKWNGKNPLDTNAAFRLTFSGTGTHSNLGFQPNGTNAYANTYFTPSVQQNINSNGITETIGTNNAAQGSDTYDIGAFNSTSQLSILKSKENNTNYKIAAGFNNITFAQSIGVNDSRGVITGTKTSSTVHKLIKNGSVLATGAGGGSLPTHPIFIGCLDYIGSPALYTNQRIQFTAIHEGLSDAETASLHTIINTFETALGRKTW